MSRKKCLEIINYKTKIFQWETGYRFSLDPLLLSGFVKLKNKQKKVLDIGTGIGIIPVLLHQRAPEWVFDAIEIQKDLYELAEENYQLNEIPGDLYFGDVKEFCHHDTYDIITCNPPFFSDGIQSPNEEVAIARHELKLDMEALSHKASKLLKTKGLFYCVYPSHRLDEALFHLRGASLKPLSIRMVYAYVDRPAVLCLILAQKGVKTPLVCEKPLVIYDKQDVYSKEIEDLFSGGSLK